MLALYIKSSEALLKLVGESSHRMYVAGMPWAMQRQQYVPSNTLNVVWTETVDRGRAQVFAEVRQGVWPASAANTRGHARGVLCGGCTKDYCYRNQAHK